MAAPVCGLSLESYVQIYKALTKSSDKVQSVTPIEECYYKMQDLRQLLQVHGMSSGKFNRCELLQALKGKALINPISISQTNPAAPAQDQPGQPAAARGTAAAAASDTPSSAGTSSDSSGLLPFSAADLAALGWAEANDVITQPLEQLQLSISAGLAGVATNHCPAVHDPTSAGPATAGAAPATAHADAAVAGLDVQQVPPPSGQHAATEGNVGAAHTGLSSGAASSAQQQGPVQQQQPAGAAGSAPAKQPLPTAAAPAGPAAVTMTGVVPAAAALQTQTAGERQAAARHSAASGEQHIDPMATEQQQQQDTQQQQQQQQGQKKEQGLEQVPGAAPEAAANRAAVQLLQQAGLYEPGPLPGHVHTPWLLQQLQRFAASGAVASQEPLLAAAAAGAAAGTGSSIAMSGAGAASISGVLLGRHVGFVLMDEMQVAGPKNTLLTLPAGVYEGCAVKYLGSSCQPELCEASCPGGHQHYRARVIPPQLPSTGQAGTGSQGDGAAAAAVFQAHAAASGRPILLILDLHPRLRCNTYRSMLQLSAGQLQDAWVLLKDCDQQCSSPEAIKQNANSSAAAAADSRKGRHHPSSQGPNNKRAKV